MNNRVTKPTKISGFPEWLPEEKLLEDKIISKIKTIYELHGFTPIETPAVEQISTLTSKGEISKEIYGIHRLQADDKESESSLALHFDLTVPLARYVALHFNSLKFPFKRYQLQKVWRGERPQEGRFREFYQFDIDIIGRDSLPLCHDAEVITVIDKVFSAIGLGKHIIRLNNRKILHGFYRSLGLEEAARVAAVTIVDKLDKIGAKGVREELLKVGLTESAADQILKISALRTKPEDFKSSIAALEVADPLFLEGTAELETIISLIPAANRASLEVDFSLARGLDYYTGTIVETYLTEHMSFGSVCGGGRYDDLASRFINQKLPGMGVSIGLTRLMSLILGKGLIKTERSSPSEALVTVFSEEHRMRCIEIAETIRSHGIPCEVYPTDAKLGKQISYADERGMRYVVFYDAAKGIEVKDLSTQQQSTVELNEWCAKISV